MRKSRAKKSSDSSLSARLARAMSLDRRFSGHDSEVVAQASARDVFPGLTQGGKVVLMIVGYVDDIGYETVRDGEVERYRHTFRKDARPLLCSSHDGRSLVIVGGRFRFTERGIVDKPRRR